MDLLHEHHRALAALADQLEAVVSRPFSADNGLKPLRLAMSTQLREHLHVEEQTLFGPCRANDATRATVLASDKDLLAMRLRYSDHIADWPPARVEQEWANYGAEVKALVASLRDRIRHEETVVYPALGQRVA